MCVRVCEYDCEYDANMDIVFMFKETTIDEDSACMSTARLDERFKNVEYLRIHLYCTFCAED